MLATTVLGLVLLIISNKMYFTRTKDKQVWKRFWFSRDMLTKNEYVVNRLGFGLTVISILLLFSLEPIFQIGRIRVYGHSMAPTLNHGDRGTVTRQVNDIDRGEIIIFRSPARPEQALVLRVVGLPGESISIDEQGQLYIGQDLMDEPYLKQQYYQHPQAISEYILATDEYWVMGDNRDDASDSRKWGPVPQVNILGKVTWRYWPLSQTGRVP